MYVINANSTVLPSPRMPGFWLCFNSSPVALPSSAFNCHTAGIKMSDWAVSVLDVYDSQQKYYPVPNTGKYWAAPNTPIPGGLVE